MTKNSLLKKLIPALAALLVLLACEIPVLSQPAAPDPASVPIETIIYGTASVAQTQTALAMPSPTSSPTLTFTPTSTATELPTATATVIFIIPTSTKPFQPYSGGQQCQVSTLVPYNPILAPREKVDISWTIRNIGKELWLDQSYDFMFATGTDMHKTDAFDMPNSVPPNAEVVFTVPMIAPKEPGSYTTTWVLGAKKETICKVSATIIVK